MQGPTHILGPIGAAILRLLDRNKPKQTNKQTDKQSIYIEWS